MVILPASAVGHDWVLIYSTFRDGISLRTMYRNMVAFENEDSPVVLVVRDDQDKVSVTMWYMSHVVSCGVGTSISSG